MNPVVLQDGTWFDGDRAIRWERRYEVEGGYSGELVRQVLWRTRHNRFILEDWTSSGWEEDEVLSKREQITENLGIVWLLNAKETIPNDLEQKVLDIEL
ncbi:MAG: hypothetical protein OXP09_21520 [Gammaproteobacteria bacterium]|nr:hypothetical protein [Rhodospirillaceae bacterium]MDE0368136.1 hypothetical protein [Gammaproteobacteria bacterium]